MFNVRVIVVIFLNFLLIISCKNTGKVTNSSFQGFTMHQPKDAVETLFEETYIEAIQAELVEKNIPKAIRKYEKCLSLDSRNAAIMYKLGSLYLDNKRIAEAEELLEQATRLKPDNVFYKERLVEAYKKMNKPDRIIKTYEDLIRLNPERLGYYFEMANVYMVSNQSEKALKVFEELEVKTGKIPEISQAKVRIYVLQNEFEKARNEGEKLIATDPSNKEYYGMLIDLYLSFGKEDMVADIYRRILTIDPEDGKAQLVLADYNHRRSNLEKSREYTLMALSNSSLDVESKISFLLINFVSKGIKQNQEVLLKYADIVVSTHPTESKSYAFRGDIYSELKMDVKAVEDYRKALEFDKDMLLLWNKVITYEAEKRNFEKAIRLADEALDYFPNSPELYYFKGISYNQMKEYAKASQNLEEGLMYIIDNETLEFQFYYNLGEIYNSSADYVKSDKYFENALKLRPDDPLILNNYAYYLSLRNEKLEKALSMSAKTLKMEPKSPSYLDTYGWILYRMGDLEQAVKYLQQAVELKPYDPDILEHLGDALYKSGKKSEAVLKWEKAIKKGGEKEKLEQKITNGI